MRHKAKAAVFAASLAFLASGAANAESGPLVTRSWGGWKTIFGAEDRLRVEQRQNFDLNDDIQDNGALIFQRFKINGRAAYGNKYEIFAEGLDARVYSAHIRKTYQTDAFDLYQGYLRVNDLAGLPLDLKMGRQELKYGKGRLLWNSAWANRSNHYDGVVAHFKAPGFYADLIHALRVNYFNHSFDEGNMHDVLDGAYMGWQKKKSGPSVEAYFLANTDARNVRKLRRYTTGVRVQAVAPGRIALDVEVPYQYGMVSESRISAYAYHADARRAFDTSWKPEVGVSYDFASGDHTPGHRNHTFVPLFQGTHEPYGIMDFFRWENMKDAGLTVSVNPVSKLKLVPQTNFFWLDSTRDYWYDSSGQKLRLFKRKGKADNYVGQELALQAIYDVNPMVKLDAAYAHFFSGDYVGDTGERDDADWVYFQINLKL